MVAVGGHHKLNADVSQAVHDLLKLDAVDRTLHRSSTDLDHIHHRLRQIPQVRREIGAHDLANEKLKRHVRRPHLRFAPGRQWHRHHELASEVLGERCLDLG